jgi:hypothetical protein
MGNTDNQTLYDTFNDMNYGKLHVHENQMQRFQWRYFLYTIATTNKFKSSWLNNIASVEFTRSTSADRLCFPI